MRPHRASMRGEEAQDLSYATSPWAEDEGVEPTDHLHGQGLANLCLSRSAYPPSKAYYISFGLWNETYD